MNAPATSPATMVDVALVGYGPTGVALANMLGLYGLSVAIFEREAEPAHLPRAVHFDGEVMRIFQSMGLADALTPHVHISKGIKYFNTAGQLLLERKPAHEIGVHGWANNFLFHQPDLEHVLRQGVARFPAIRTSLCQDVVEVIDAGDHVELRTRDTTSGVEATHHARWVVGCDGGRSMVRQAIGPHFEDFGLHQLWLVVDVLLSREIDLPDATVQICDPARPITCVRGTGRRRRWEIMVMPGDDPQTIDRPDTVWQLLSPWLTPQDGELVRRALYTFHSLIAEKWRKNRLLIAGDSAHQTPPFLGQGLCAGIRDAANLGWKLASVVNGASEDLLDTYQSERHAHVRAFIQEAVRLGSIIQTTDPQVAAARDQAMLRGGPEEMVNLSPPLGPGLHQGGRVAGTILAQPRLSTGQLLDDAIGKGFGLIGAAPLDPPLARCVADISGDLVSIVDEALAPWLKEADARWIVLRPDRYVFGTANCPDELEELLRSLSVALETRRQQHALEA
ncbi:bifunctional 3-(3-hydroxy-phenyl)propionate/3-hydroxycinnamic acid hydroxylase [Methylocella sp. CPCC 101449]|uniref:bifunctional 3-(3-hydroxy-phenyl)propionate/3-hydroxycinnamic acid hydroxylase MhpA n=1 Tax=Methylocella sp. CPCC 101449 TaxID=2987531 RepID=UPI00288F19EE|nr:bifunctional 3-(3-hydroxy-phenyl)propionate/3-hydroxycinnamic acid hydroxylase [Methylocella sp. CPCC 101449]MDT2023746.1 bifunctional 3-(3-hydroxy-phenyl)propionate/3-hydroxycinnamic acid hydroxylase [Methylocella sp. CPCC 101449]